VTWRERPTLIEDWTEDIDYIMAIDENGTTDLRGIKLKIMLEDFEGIPVGDDPDRWFTITGVVMARENFAPFRDDIMQLKRSYWPDGKFQYKTGLKRVCFHSRDIRKQEGPFNPRIINISNLARDISGVIKRANFTLFSSSIDKVRHLRKYLYPKHVYELCLEFIVERFARFLNEQRKKGILWLESRGKNEDFEILRFLTNFFATGNEYYRPSYFNCIIGVYFNPKWNRAENGQTSFILLELADLCSYPIHKFVKYGTRDPAFEVVVRKLRGYPSHDGIGLKIFP